MTEMVERLARVLHEAHYHRGRGIAPPWPTDRLDIIYLTKQAVEGSKDA